jgi:hypothetical protein
MWCKTISTFDTHIKNRSKMKEKIIVSVSVIFIYISLIYITHKHCLNEAIKSNDDDDYFNTEFK